MVDEQEVRKEERAVVRCSAGVHRPVRPSQGESKGREVRLAAGAVAPSTVSTAWWDGGCVRVCVCECECVCLGGG